MPLLTPTHRKKSTGRVCFYRHGICTPCQSNSINVLKENYNYDIGLGGINIFDRIIEAAFILWRAPWYLADYCVPVSTVPGRQHLRSASRRQLIVPRVSRSTFGGRAYAIACPTVWNSLPDSFA